MKVSDFHLNMISSIFKCEHIKNILARIFQLISKKFFGAYFEEVEVEPPYQLNVGDNFSSLLSVHRVAPMNRGGNKTKCS